MSVDTRYRLDARRRGSAAAALLAATLLLSSCSLAKVAYLEIKPMRGFVAHEREPRVHFEPGAQDAADAVVQALEEATRRIERSHGARIETAPSFYVCASQACWERYAFALASAAETRPRGNTVLLNGKRLLAENRVLAVVAHELSHVFWHQRGIRCQPRWWTEGLAVAASGGGGAERVSAAAAAQAVRDGQGFGPLDESCWVRDSAVRAGLSWPMFYRQSGLFVAWLEARDASAFAATLVRLRGGDDLIPALQASYGACAAALLQQWQGELSAPR